MNFIRRAITAEGKRLIILSPKSALQEQRVSSSTYARSTSRVLKSSKVAAPAGVAALPPSTPSSSLKDVVPKEPVTWARPSEIPWQAKVVNLVNLIGRVKIPVQFENSSDGKCWAGTIISQDDGSESPSYQQSFWIPVIFKDDLAHTAMCHLKEKDYVHVVGHLSGDVPPFKLGEVQANVQVMAHSINFVQESRSKNVSTPGVVDSSTTKNSVHNPKQTGRVHLDDKVNKESIHVSWRDLLSNSKQWWDNREAKHKGLVKANYPDFKHKDTGVGLWLDKATAEVLQGLKQLDFGVPPSKREKDGDFWQQLVENPERWWDNRLHKKNPKSPDFKNKDSGKGLWLQDAPIWALSKLPPLRSKTS